MRAGIAGKLKGIEVSSHPSTPALRLALRDRFGQKIRDEVLL
jgi:hypothetical protein